MAFWRDLSIIWLSLFCFVGLLLPLVALYFVVRGVNTLHTKTRPLLQKAQNLSQQARLHTERASDKVSQPVIQMQSQIANVETRLKKLL